MRRRKRSRIGVITAGLAGLIIVGVAVGIIVVKNASAERLVEAVTVEAGSAVPDISSFFMKEEPTATYITDMSTIPMNKPGVYDIQLQVGKKEYASKLEVIDSIAPEAETVDYEIWPEENKEAADFVTNIVDVTDVAVSFEEEPDYSKTGEQEVAVALTDEGGNKTIKKASLTIKADTEAPVIEGVKDQTVFVGDKISYKQGVTVTDNRDENVELDIDNSTVNLKQVGTYQVVYTAKDTAGNATTATATITVKEKPKQDDSEELDKLADRILAKIIKDDMTDVGKAWAIFKWTKFNIGYVNTSDHSDWKKGALQGLKKGTGDCFVYYSTAKLLLEKVGFETQTVIRSGGRSTIHYWNLVKFEEGWYHFDTTPTIEPNTAFLRTDDELELFNKKVKNYYNFDKTKHPATPTEPLEERSDYLK